MTEAPALSKLLAEHRYDIVETLFKEALQDPAAKADFLLNAVKSLGRVTSQKSHLQALVGTAEAALKPRASDLAIAHLRWSLLKEAVRAGATFAEIARSVDASFRAHGDRNCHPLRHRNADGDAHTYQHRQSDCDPCAYAQRSQ